MIRKSFCLSIGLVILMLWVRSATAVYPHTPAANCDPDGMQTSGAIYRICVPNSWNGDLIVYAHGYVSPTEPIGIPEDQIVIGGNSIIDLVNLLGYAFATTSYSTNGLAVQDGIADVVDLVDIFESQYGQPNQIYLAGVSEGGLITVLTIELHPDIFDGGLALCGPYGDFGKQINYFGDGRVVFDYFFPALMPGDPTNIPQSLIDNWNSHYQDNIAPVITDPTNANDVAQYLTVVGAPYYPSAPISNTQTVASLLWYNVFATNDAAIKLGGQPFTNTHRIYSGSDDDVTLNASIARFDGDQAVLDEIEVNYVTSGIIERPIVTLHTTADPVVPYWHTTLYEAKISNVALYDHFSAERYGHCAFTAEEVLIAFGRLLEMVQGRIYLPMMRLE